MRISSLKKSEVEFVATLQPDGWGDLRTHHHFYTTHDFCYPIKIVEDRQLVGIGTGIIHGDVGWIAHIIVHRDHRNRGLGQLITQTVMDTILKKGCRSLNLIATDLGAPVYEKLGFKTDTEYLFFKDIKIPDLTEPKDGDIRPYEPSFREAILRLDNFASDEKRAMLINPHLQDAAVCFMNSHVCGYYLPTLGDGLVIAANAEAGIALMRQRLWKNDHACFPSNNSAATNLMNRYGLCPYRISKRMFYGTKANWRPEMLFNRIGGNLG